MADKESVYSNSITAPSQETLVINLSVCPCVWVPWGLQQRLQMFKHRDIENVLEQIKENFLNVFAIPVIGYVTNYREILQCIFNYTSHSSPSFCLLSYLLLSKKIGEKCDQRKMWFGEREEKNMKLRPLVSSLLSETWLCILRWEKGQNQHVKKKVM